MNFKDAVEKANQGHNLRRTNSEASFCSMAVPIGHLLIKFTDSPYTVLEGAFNPSEEDRSASDWEIAA